MSVSTKDNAPAATAPTVQGTAAPPRIHRVLKIAPTSFFADYGCHVRIYEEIRALQRLGHQVTICTYPTGRDLPGMDIRRAVNTPWRRTVQVGSSIHKLYYDGLLAARTLQVALQVRPTVVHAHLHEGALIGSPISRILRVPLLFDFQGSLTSEMLDHKFLRRTSRLFRPLRTLEGIINKAADRIITSSSNAADMLAQEFGYPAERIITLPDSVDTEVFAPRAAAPQAALHELRVRWRLPVDRPLVVYLGLLAEYQGTGLLLEAAAQLLAQGVQAHFLVMGFPGEADYRAQAAQMGLSEHMTFTGRIPYEEAPHYLALGDIAVSPKMSETEGNGKLLNYMAVGLPTVTFDTPVAHELLGDAGVYAETGSATDLARALRTLLTDPPARTDRGWRLQRRAEAQFSWDATGRRLLDIYSELSR